MKHLVLHRYNIGEKATSGLFTFDGKFLAHTLENSKTLVRPGRYELRLSHSPTWSPRLGTSILEVVEPGTDRLGERDQILIHPANYYHQLRGCIAPGIISSFEHDEAMVGHSQRAYDITYAIITEAMKHTGVIIHIVEKVIPLTGEVG